MESLAYFFKGSSPQEMLFHIICQIVSLDCNQYLSILVLAGGSISGLQDREIPVAASRYYLADVVLENSDGPHLKNFQTQRPDRWSPYFQLCYKYMLKVIGINSCVWLVLSFVQITQFPLCNSLYWCQDFLTLVNTGIICQKSWFCLYLTSHLLY